MAETIGLIGSLVSIAGAGLTLAQKLLDYSAGVASSGKRTQDIAFHVRSTATVVEEVANIFKEEGSARRNLISQKAIETVEDVVKQCSALFDQLNQALDSTGNGGGLGKLLFPLRESKLVIIYARLKAEKNDDDQSQRMLIQELIVLRKQAAATYERNKIKAQEEDEREPWGPLLPDSNGIPSEMQLPAGEPTTQCLGEEDKEAPASIAANAKPPICNHDLDSAADSGESTTSIRLEQIDGTNETGRSQPEKRDRHESLATSLGDPKIATEPAQNRAGTSLHKESPELARAWDDLVHAIDQLVHALAVACCCCCAKRKSKPTMRAGVGDPALRFPEIPGEENRNGDLNKIRRQYNRDGFRRSGSPHRLSRVPTIPRPLYSQELQSSSPRLGPTSRSGARASIPLGALPSQEEPMYVVASYEVDELLNLWTNLSQESSGTTPDKNEE